MRLRGAAAAKCVQSSGGLDHLELANGQLLHRFTSFQKCYARPDCASGLVSAYGQYASRSAAVIREKTDPDLRIL